MSSSQESRQSLPAAKRIVRELQWENRALKRQIDLAMRYMEHMGQRIVDLEAKCSSQSQG